MRLRSFAVLAMCVSLPLPVAAQDLVTLDRGSIYELTWHGRDKLIAHVYVSRNATQKGPIAITIGKIVEGHRSDPRFTNDFQVNPRQLRETDAAFDIFVAGPTLLKAATYDATLTFAAGGTRQSVNIQVIVPAATLSVPATLQLSRVYWPFRGVVPEGGSDLLLLETSGKSDVSVRIQQSEPFSNSEGQYGTGVAIGTVSVPKGKLQSIATNVTTALPLGTASGKLSLTSEQFPAPLTVAVQVRTRLTRFALFLTIVFGLLIGYLLRTRLKPSIELLTAVDDASNALEAITYISTDANYRRDVDALRAALTSAARAAGATPATIKAAIDAVDAAHKEAVNRLRERLKTASQSRDLLAAVVTPQWKLPDAIRAAVVEAAPHLAEASGHVDRMDAAATEHAVAAGADGVHRGLLAHVGPWRTKVERLLHQLHAVDPLIDAAVKAEYAAELKRIEDQLARTGVAPTLDLGEIRTTIEAIHAVTELLPRVTERTAQEVKDSFDVMDATLADVANDPDDWAAVRAQTQKFETQVRGITLEAEATWRTLDDDARALYSRWATGVEKQSGGAERVHEAFKRSDFRGVAREAGAGQTKPQTLGEQRVDDTEARGSARRPGSADWSPPAGKQQRPAPKVDDPDTRRFIARTRKKLARARRLEWAVSSVVLSFIGYLIFADKFVGTNADLMAAFAWGFTTDVGVDALVTAAKSKPQ